MSSTGPDRGSADPSALEQALTWLGAPPADDPLVDLAPLRGHLAAIAGTDIKPLQYLKILELFQRRADSTADAVRPLLLDATLPVPKRLRTVAQGIMLVHEALAAGYQRVLRKCDRDELSAFRRSPADLCALGLSSLSRQFETAQFVSASVSREFWERAQSFHGLIARDSSPETETRAEEAMLHMKTMLALAAAQPDGFSPRETAFLSACLRRLASAVEIRNGEAASPDGYWLDAARGFPPTAATRRPPPSGGNSVHFSCIALSRLAQQQQARLAAGESPEQLGLPPEAALAAYAGVLARAAQRWSSPPKRQGRRRAQGYRVEVCTHLGPLWQQLSGGGAAEAAVELPASDWMILNESPSGYAIMHVAGELAGLVAGSAIGLRAAADRPWNICIVRWARSENPEHIELGIELVAPHAEAVRVSRRGPDGTTPPVPALLLPPLPALDRGEALLTARGHFAPGSFALIHEMPERVQVSECVAGRLATHTACIEIFEFERRPVPA